MDFRKLFSLMLCWSYGLVFANQEISEEIQSLREMMMRSLTDVGHILENVKEIQVQHEEILQSTKSEMSEVRFEVLANRNAIGEAKLAIGEQAVKMSEALNKIQEYVQKEEKGVEIDEPDSTLQSLAYPRDCADIQKNGATESGVYTIYVSSENALCGADLEPLEVYCDLKTDGGGWTVLLRRIDASGDFPNQNWTSYAKGFGRLCSSFWLGNEYIHKISQHGGYSLRIDLQAWTGEAKYATYDEFWLGPSTDKFRLFVKGYKGTAGDNLSYHSGSQFSTKDMDNDVYKQHCAQKFESAWWFKTCLYCSLTGNYLIGTHGTGTYKGVMWSNFKGNKYSHMRAEMKIRPVDFQG